MHEQLSLFEEWRPVPGWEGIYSVSNTGKLRRDLRVRGARGGKVIPGSLDSYGYRIVILVRHSRRWTTRLHRLVALAFLGDRKPGQEVNHRDGNKLNNRLDNLEYVTHGENLRHAYRLALRLPLRGPRNNCARLTEGQVRAIRAASGTCRDLAKAYGVGSSTISGIRRRKAWRWLS